MSHAIDHDDIGATELGALIDAKQQLVHHASQLQRLAAALDERFLVAVDLLGRCRGRVVVSGIGKSGIAARKIAAILACTGTPAFYLHPGDAAHGDLGSVSVDDVVVLVSVSGETTEVAWLLPHFERLGTPVIAITGAPSSTLGCAATVALVIDVDEAAPAVVPTTSSLVAQALGDALALAVMRQRRLSVSDVAPLHPGSPSPTPRFDRGGLALAAGDAGPAE